MKKIGMVVLLYFISVAYAADLKDGKVIRVKGEAFLKEKDKWVPVKEQQPIPPKGTFKTEKKSFLVVQFPNKTKINIGPNSKYNYVSTMDGKGQVYKFIIGKMRAIIQKKLGDGEKIRFKNKAVALGVRGTEFLQNSYIVNGKATSDVALLKGKLAVNAKASAPNLKNFMLKSGESFNTNELALNGMSAVKQIPADILKSLKNGADLLSNLQLPSGAAAPIGLIAGVGAGIASGIGNALGSAVGSALASGGDSSGSKDEDETLKVEEKPKQIQEAKKQLEKPVVKRKKKKSKGPKTMVQGLINFKYVIKDEPQDIREPLLRRKQDLKANKCYYYIYKQIGGYGKKLLFKRQRDCDEYDYDL